MQKIQNAWIRFNFSYQKLSLSLWYLDFRAGQNLGQLHPDQRYKHLVDHVWTFTLIWPQGVHTIFSNSESDKFHNFIYFTRNRINNCSYMFWSNFYVILNRMNNCTYFWSNFYVILLFILCNLSCPRCISNLKRSLCFLQIVTKWCCNICDIYAIFEQWNDSQLESGKDFWGWQPLWAFPLAIESKIHLQV